MNQVSREPLNGFALNSHGIPVWSLARLSLNVKSQRSKVKVTRDKFPPPPLKMHCNALAENNVMQQKGSFRRCWGVMGVHRQPGRSVIYVEACVRFMFGRTSLASSLFLSLLPAVSIPLNKYYHSYNNLSNVPYYSRTFALSDFCSICQILFFSDRLGFEPSYRTPRFSESRNPVQLRHCPAALFVHWIISETVAFI